jgi:hypothetical protein
MRTKPKSPAAACAANNIESDGVRCQRLTALDEMADCLRSLPEDMRLHLLRELAGRGCAECYDYARGCAYYIVCDEGQILVWTWQPIASLWEAAILRSLLQSMTQPLDDQAALELLDRATNRRAAVLVAPVRRQSAAPGVIESPVVVRVARVVAERIYLQFRRARSLPV